MLEEAEEKAIRESLSRLASLEGHGELVTNIVAVLAKEIIEGTLAPGIEITSVDLSNRFHTSRTPVREALSVLQCEGLIEIRSRRRPHVSTMSAKEIRDIYLVRASLYDLITQEIIKHASDSDIAKLREPLAAMEAALADRVLSTFFASSVEFRTIEAQICGNDAVQTMIDSLGLRVFGFRRFGLSLPGRMETSFEDHRRLYEAYVQRDEEFARAITKTLVTSALKAIEVNIDEVTEPKG